MVTHFHLLSQYLWKAVWPKKKQMRCIVLFGIHFFFRGIWLSCSWHGKHHFRFNIHICWARKKSWIKTSCASVDCWSTAIASISGMVSFLSLCWSIINSWSSMGIKPQQQGNVVAHWHFSLYQLFPETLKTYWVYFKILFHYDIYLAMFSVFSRQFFYWLTECLVYSKFPKFCLPLVC